MAGTIAALFHMAGAGFILARDGAFGLVDSEPLPARAQLMIRLGRLVERRDLNTASRAERVTLALALVRS